MTFDEWRRATKVDSKSRFAKGAPSKQQIVVRPNPHQRGRAHIAVLNPGKDAEVDVDLSRCLAAGDKFRIVSAKDFYGPALISGVYNGLAVRIPMRPVTPPPPVGMPNAELPVTEPQFAVFVLLPDELLDQRQN